MKPPHFWVLTALLAAAMILLHARGDVDYVPPSKPLDQLPTVVGGWVGQDVAISQDVLDVLGKGVFLNRVYQQGLPAGNRPVEVRPQGVPVGFFVAYFPTQRSGQSIHSPQNCLPGAGWTFDSSGVTEFTDANGKTFRVGDYIISNGSDRQEVLYWYQSHGRSIANDYVAKLYMLTNSIRYGRTDAALVRVITPVERNEGRQSAHERVVLFARMVTPLLPAYVPD